MWRVFSFRRRLARLEQWFIGHACEITPVGLSVAALRADTARDASRLEVKADKSFSEWLASIGWSGRQSLTLMPSTSISDPFGIRPVEHAGHHKLAAHDDARRGLWFHAVDCT